MVTRSDLSAYLSGTYGTLLSDFGVGATDATGALKEPIDRALLRLGTAYGMLTAPTVDDANAEGAFALASYYLLLKMQGGSAARNVNISVDGPSMSKGNSARAGNLQAAMDAVLIDMTRLGIAAGLGWHTGTIGFGVFEPTTEVW